MFRRHKTAILTLVSIFSIGFISLVGISTSVAAFNLSLTDDERISRHKSGGSLDGDDKKRAEILIHILDTCKVKPVAPVSQARDNAELSKIMAELADQPGNVQASKKIGGDANQHFYATADRINEQGEKISYLYKFPRIKPGGGDFSYNKTDTATWRNTCLDKIKEFGQSSNQLIAAGKEATEKQRATAGAEILHGIICPRSDFGQGGMFQQDAYDNCRAAVLEASTHCSAREIYVEGAASRAPTAAETQQCLRQRLQGKTSREKLNAITSSVADQFNQAAAGVEEIKPRGSNSADSEAAAEDENETSCDISGVGWVVCPVMTFMAEISDAAYGVIDNFLAVNMNIMDTSSGTYSAWTAFRNIANAAFIVVFLVIIYSQITGAGLGAYGVKKMLPRLLVGAILVNISFFITQLMVDLTQIMGATLKDFLVNMPTGSGADSPPHTWTDTVARILTGTAVVAGVVAGGAILLTSISGPVLLAFALAVLMTVIILIGRQAAIVMLVVLSPLAFVAYLLPNTESLFKKWLKMFWSLLMLYPIVALLYGGGHLASRIIQNAGASGGTDDGGWWLQITALGVAAVPLIMTPFVLRGALNATGKFGAKLSGMSQKASSRVGGKVSETSRFGEAQSAFKQRRAVARANRRINSGIHKRIDQSRLGRLIGGDRGAAAAAASVTKVENEAVDNASVVMQKQEGWTASNAIELAQGELAQAIQKGDTTRARAAQKILFQSGSKGVAAASETLSRNIHAGNIGTDTVQLLKADVTSAGLKGKDAALDAWSRDNEVLQRADGSKYVRTVLDKAKDPKTLDGLTDTELAGQSVHRIAEGGMSAGRAKEIMDNTNVWANLSEDKKRIIRQASTQTGGVRLQTNSTVNAHHSQALKEYAKAQGNPASTGNQQQPAQPTPAQPAPAQPPQPGPGNTPGTPPQTPGGTPPATPGGPTGP